MITAVLTHVSRLAIIDPALAKDLIALRASQVAALHGSFGVQLELL